MAISTSPVHQATATGTSVTITAAASGNTLVLMIANYRSSGARTVSSISCTNTTGWTKSEGNTNGNLGVEIWVGYCTGTSGTTITITMSGSGSTLAVNATEWSGVLTPPGTTGDDGSANNTGASTSPATAAYSSTVNFDLLLCCEGHLNGTKPSVMPGGIWTETTWANNSTSVGVQGEYAVPRPVGSVSASWTITSAAWVTAICGLKVSPKTGTLTAGTATMAAGVVKQDAKALAGVPPSMVARLMVPAAVFSRKTGHGLLAALTAVWSVVYNAAKPYNLYYQTLSAAVAAWSVARNVVVAKVQTGTPGAWSAAIGKLRTAYEAIGASIVNFTAGINKQGQKPFAASMTAFAALLLRGRLLAASAATMAGVLVRMTARSLISSMASAGGGLVRQVNKVAAASMATAVAALTRLISHLSASSMATMAVTLARQVNHAVATASLVAMAGALVKQGRKALSAATAAMAAALIRGRLLAASMATATVVFTKATAKSTWSAAMSTFSVTFTGLHLVLKGLTASISTFAAAMVKQIQRMFNAS